eukprot:Nk52_evm6s298 gene=Nk52_evmTU6s298
MSIFKEQYPGKDFMPPAAAFGDANGDYYMLQLPNSLCEPNSNYPEWPVREIEVQKKQPQGISVVINTDKTLKKGRDISTYYEFAIEQLKEFHEGSGTWREPSAGCNSVQ